MLASTGAFAIFHHYDYSSGDASQQLLEAYRVRGGVLEQVMTVPLAYDVSGADPAGGGTAYQASYELTKESDGTRGVDVTGKQVTGFPGDLPDGAVLGTGRFRGSGDRLTRRGSAPRQPARISCRRSPAPGWTSDEAVSGRFLASAASRGTLSSPSGSLRFSNHGPAPPARRSCPGTPS